MFNEDYKLLVSILEKIKDIKEITKNISSREEFACNDNNIKLGLGFLIDLTNITSNITPLTILASTYLTKELPILTRYKECIFNKDNSINAYKLYDFLTLELDSINNEIRLLLSK